MTALTAYALTQWLARSVGQIDAPGRTVEVWGDPTPRHDDTDDPEGHDDAVITLAARPTTGDGPVDLILIEVRSKTVPPGPAERHDRPNTVEHGAAMPDLEDHAKCMRARLVGSCGALAECEHDGVRVYTEWGHWRQPVLAITPEREAELRAAVGPCV